MMQSLLILSSVTVLVLVGFKILAISEGQPIDVLNMPTEAIMKAPTFHVKLPSSSYLLKLTPNQQHMYMVCLVSACVNFAFHSACHKLGLSRLFFFL